MPAHNALVHGLVAIKWRINIYVNGQAWLNAVGIKNILKHC
jgi:hypothetical protein